MYREVRNLVALAVRSETGEGDKNYWSLLRIHVLLV